jgi:hypothetical protein
MIGGSLPLWAEAATGAAIRMASARNRIRTVKRMVFPLKREKRWIARNIRVDPNNR